MQSISLIGSKLPLLDGYVAVCLVLTKEVFAVVDTFFIRKRLNLTLQKNEGTPSPNGDLKGLCYYWHIISILVSAYTQKIIEILTFKL